jgi:hypothetical protein
MIPILPLCSDPIFEWREWTLSIPSRQSMLHLSYKVRMAAVAGCTADTAAVVGCTGDKAAVVGCTGGKAVVVGCTGDKAAVGSTGGKAAVGCMDDTAEGSTGGKAMVGSRVGRAAAVVNTVDTARKDRQGKVKTYSDLLLDSQFALGK